ncbi:MAG TPA: aminoacyl-tRNA hydrolase [Deltaproteobacteria bacterium]|jgi:PTH1 family peptidyl-tRNA hydrolase|nr:aminoacyl-tRNA hydrolase [Deltaproteobacteria bacterium]HNS90417.1 aminoacyl-tRNA hydrolase [Deltaproteobacteria bacterium]HOA43651.1 aminoacyl-tRNA hydrolase [Deltaproteobacteria bacterium]HOC75162.1 aminoacyl-tRNA hydrolase [Deltaproteobacteria bacterium]HOG83820.1 aminoacyl-tRNA hydrolase [Deltaproteobacteria bacterium]
MKLIYGLGNPGGRYERNRHNVGFMVVDHIARKWGISVKRMKVDVLCGSGRVAGVETTLAKPQTFMNLSGAPLRMLHVDAEDLVVIHDDMDIPFGQVRIKKSGGTGGHKGLESIRGALGTGEFLRVRFGIGRPPGDMDPSDYVLEDIPPVDREGLVEQIEKAASAVELCVRGEVTRAMNAFNRRVTSTEQQE